MYVVIAVLVVIGLVLVGMYNGLVTINERVNEAWSDINVQLKRRADLIPNLIDTVKGYAKHEKTVFTDVTKARTAIMSADGVKETAEADNMFTQALKSVFAVAESYPDLKASENFKELQAELTDTEDKIQAARRFYNGSVRDLNIKVKVFPTNIFANMLGFSKRDFYEVDESEAATIKKAPKVSFDK